MGWSDCGLDSEGRPIGYSYSGICDLNGCDVEIDRGLAYACGGEHLAGADYCEEYFCYAHQYMSARGQRCPECLKLVAEEE